MARQVPSSTNIGEWHNPLRGFRIRHPWPRLGAWWLEQTLRKGAELGLPGHALLGYNTK